MLLQTVFGFSQLQRYKEHREPNSKLIAQGVDYTIEKLKNKKYVYKQYYPETKVNTQLITFKSKKFMVKDGLYLERFDDGKIIREGDFVNNKKEGAWKEYSWAGKYKNGKRVGEWVSHDEKNRLKSRSNFVNGQLHGVQIKYDTLGQKLGESIYKNALFISTTIDTSYKETETLPRFAGCEKIVGTEEEKKVCADKKMMNYVYQKLKYPKQARKDGIDGIALVRFVIDKDGTVTDIKVLRGLCKEIKEECIKLVSNMPKWIPGYYKGEPVKVKYTLPIKFNLK